MEHLKAASLGTVRDKRSSLLKKFATYDRKKFYNIGPMWRQCYKTFYVSPMFWTNKLERLSKSKVKVTVKSFTILTIFD
jgi:hypothetical protein